jgi:hypothetical protein
LNFSDNSSVLVGNSLYSAQLSKTSNSSLEDSIKTALSNRLSIINAEGCYETLKKYYNISSEKSLLISKTDINSYTELDNLDKPLVSNSAQINIYDPDTRKELNISLCDSNQFIIKTPIKSADLLNLTQYSALKSSGIDGFNPNDTSFTDICSTYIDNSTQFDTTLNFRRSNYYQNKTASCTGTNCTYNSIDSNSYVSCNCTSIKPSTPIGNQFVDFILAPLSTWNYQVIYCYNLIFSVNVYI